MSEITESLKKLMLSGVASFCAGCVSLPPSTTNLDFSPPLRYEDECLEAACLVYTHPVLGEVALQGMVHFGDAAFFSEVTDFCSRYDRVITEGVRGGDQAFFTQWQLEYLIGLGERFSYLNRLNSQAFHLGPFPYEVNGDVSFDELAARHDILEHLSLAATSLGSFLIAEPTYSVLNFSDTLGDYMGYPLVRELMLRSMCQVLATDALDSQFLPAESILHLRNRHVIDVALKTLAEPGVSRVVLPWGAAHLPGLEHLLVKNGFRRTGIDYKRVIDTRHLSQGSVELERIPFVWYVARDGGYQKVQILFGLIGQKSFENQDQFEILWGLLVGADSSEDHERWHILPRINGRPLFIGGQTSPTHGEVFECFYFFRF